MEAAAPSRILITGFSGFLGSYLIEQCRATYPESRLFGICKSLPLRAEASSRHDITPIAADITQVEQMRRAVAQSQPDWVFHLAAQSSVASSWADPASTLLVNTGGTLQLLEALRAEHLSPRIILAGSGEQYGLVRPDENPISEECPFRPISPYGVSKSAQDLAGYQYFVAYNLPILRARLFNTFGPRQSALFVVADFARQIARIEQDNIEAVLTVGNLEARRDFLPAEDAVQALLALARHGQPGQAYNIGSGRAHSIREMLDILLEFARVSIQVRQDPTRLRPSDVPLLIADISRLREQADWAPAIDLAYALKQTLNYWREHVATDQGRSD